MKSFITGAEDKSRYILLLLATALCCLSFAVNGEGYIPAIKAQQPDTADRISGLAGIWDLRVAVDGSSDNQPSLVLVMEVKGNKLAGKVTVPKVDSTANGIQTTGSRELVLSDIRLNEKTLSFKIIDDGNDLYAELSKRNDNEFEGRWRSPVQGRWKNASNEFAGAIRLKRQK